MENRFLVGIILLTGFILAVSAASMYAQSQILGGTACGCQFPIEILIPLFASTGVLVGSLVYYFMSSHLRAKKDFSAVLSLVEYDERAIIQELMKAGGGMPQSRLVASTGMSKVKVSRVLSDLEAKGVIKKKASGVTNDVELSEKLKKSLL